MEMTVVVTPQLKRSNEKVAAYLEKTEHDGLFLPFPKGTEEHVARLAEGSPLHYLIYELKKSELAPEPLKPWISSTEPLLRVLPRLRTTNEALRLYCYGDLLYRKYSFEVAVTISTLILRTSMTGKIDTEEWKQVFKKDLEFRKEALSRETDFVALKASCHDITICVSNLHGQYMVSQLRQEGYNVQLKCLDPSYTPTPIECLQGTLNAGEISDKRLKKIILSQVKYVKEFVLTSDNIDEAYQKWLKSRGLKGLLRSIWRFVFST